jgi:hypothetical protein
VRPFAADPERLEDVCWLGHAPWLDTSLAPRWRVVVPLAEPVSAEHWRDVWLRDRAALCPEADPSCKDASRRYYVPSHESGALHQATHHPAWRHARRQHVARVASRASAVAVQEACPCQW